MVLIILPFKHSMHIPHDAYYVHLFCNDFLCYLLCYSVHNNYGSQAVCKWQTILSKSFAPVNCSSQFVNCPSQFTNCFALTHHHTCVWLAQACLQCRLQNTVFYIIEQSEQCHLHWQMFNPICTHVQRSSSIPPTVPYHWSSNNHSYQYLVVQWRTSVS